MAGMRVVVIADIHGNLAALEAALAEVERLRPDQLVVAGDVVDGGPDSAACWERVKALGCPVLRGNHERYVYHLHTEEADPAWALPQFGPLHFAHAELTPTQIAELAALPFQWSRPEAPGLLVVHASLRSDNDSVFAYTSEEALGPMFPGVAGEVSVIVRGHNHQCAARGWGGRRIVTCGSVGLPQDGNPAAQFVVLDRIREEWRVRHQAVRYDVQATLRRFRETGYLEKTGPIGKLFYREVETATFHIVPFLRFYGALQQAGEVVEVSEALRRFQAR